MFSPEQRRDTAFDALRSRVSLARIVSRAAESAFFDGCEGEYLTEVARRNGVPFDASRPVLDWEFLAQRAETVGAAAGGGFLVGQEALLPAADALLPSVVCMQLGATTVQVRGPNFGLPRQTGVPTAQWASNEAFAASESQPVFGQTALTPHSAIGYVETSRLLLLQSDVDVVLKRDLLVRSSD